MVLYLQVAVEGISIDKEMLKAGGTDSLDFFQITTNGSVLVRQELDMLLPLDVFKEMNAPSRANKKRMTMSEPQDMWDDGMIPYHIVSSSGEQYDHVKTELSAAMSEWSKFTCITFKQVDDASLGVAVKTLSTCHATQGNLLSGTAELSIHPSCSSRRIILHLLGHIIGLTHEMNRPDRDTYIKITRPVGIYGYNINSSRMDTFGIIYDYRSIMHFGYFIKTLDPQYQEVIGNVHGLSFADIKLTNLMYHCDSLACSNTPMCPFNGFVLPKPHKGRPACECWCDSGDKLNDDPLVLCSTLTKSQEPVYNLKGAGSADNQNKAACEDIMGECLVWKNKNLCLSEPKKMKILCPKTCHFCDKEINLCMNYDDGCVMMAQTVACMDPALKHAMTELCPKACSICGKPATSCEINDALGIP